MKKNLSPSKNEVVENEMAGLASKEITEGKFRASEINKDIKSLSIKDYERLELGYKCIFADCDLFYYNLSALRKHLESYNHRRFCSGKESVKCCKIGCAERFTEEHIMAHRGNRVEISNMVEKIKSMTYLFREESAVANTVPFSFLIKRENEISPIVIKCFEKGILEIKYAGSDKYVCHCPLPGCLKSFRSVPAYRYHALNQPHCLNKFIEDSGIEIDKEKAIRELKEVFKQKKLFVLSGVVHHTPIAYDKHYNITFSYDFEERGDLGDKSGSTQGLTELNADWFLERTTLKGSWGSPERIRISAKHLYCFYGENIFCMDIQPYQGTFRMALGLKPYKVDEVHVFSFKKGQSEIIIVDYDLMVIDTIPFEFGYVRKISFSIEKAVYKFMVLFNDGRLRRFSYSEDSGKVSDQEFVRIENPIIDFTSYENKFIILDGFSLYRIDSELKIEQNFMIGKIPIIMMDLRRQIRPGIKIENGLRLRSRTAEGAPDRSNLINNDGVFILDASGAIFFVDIGLSGKLQILENLGTTYIKYYATEDILLISDTLTDRTNYIDLSKKKPTPILIWRKAILSSELDRRGLFLGSRSGCLEFFYRFKNGVLSVNLLNVLDHIDLTFEVNSVDYDETTIETNGTFKPYHENLLTSTYIVDNWLIALFESGHIFRIDLTNIIKP